MKQRQKTLKELFEGIEFQLTDELAGLPVSGVQYDSRKVKKGHAFVAIRGFATDGHRFLANAVENGASVLIVEEQQPSLAVPQVVVPDTRKILGKLAFNFFSPEIEQLALVGITGTNGKTTTSFLVQSILNEGGLTAGLIGTIQYQIGSQRLDAWNTTPESVDICQMLFDLHQQNYKACVLEVSSHALSLHRVDALKFKVAVFTNLTRDHLDFHKTLEDYFETKMKLFSLLAFDGNAVVNIDDPFGAKALDRIEQPVMTFGRKKSADIHPLQAKVTMDGIDLRLSTPFGEVEIRSSLTGDFNVQNIQAAVGVGLAMGLPLETVKRGVEKVKHVPGRLESYQVKPGVRAVIDYAHTPDSLEKALQTLKKLTAGRLIVVFGAGGDRDRGKRPLMGRVAEQNADVVFVTSDNPRTEKPEKIIDDILEGIEYPENCRVIVDRKEAIFAAVKEAQSGDVILVAGKGHETYQDVNGVKHPFDEVALLKEAARRV